MLSVLAHVYCKPFPKGLLWSLQENVLICYVYLLIYCLDMFCLIRCKGRYWMLQNIRFMCKFVINIHSKFIHYLLCSLVFTAYVQDNNPGCMPLAYMCAILINQTAQISFTFCDADVVISYLQATTSLVVTVQSKGKCFCLDLLCYNVQHHQKETTRDAFVSQLTSALIDQNAMQSQDRLCFE